MDVIYYGRCDLDGTFLKYFFFWRFDVPAIISFSPVLVLIFFSFFNQATIRTYTLAFPTSIAIILPLMFQHRSPTAELRPTEDFKNLIQVEM